MAQNSEGRSRSKPPPETPGGSKRHEAGSGRAARKGDRSPDPAPNELSESIEGFRSVFENAPSGIALVSLDGSVLDANSTLCSMAKYSHEEIVGKTFAETSHPDDLEDGLTRMEQLLNGEIGAYRVERRFIDANGQAVWTDSSVALVRDGEGVPLYFVAQLHDISERRAAVEAAAEANERFRHAFEDAPVGMVIAMLDGHIADVNPALCAALGYTREELIGRDIADITYPGEPVLCADDIQRLLERGSAIKALEKRYLHADGHAVWARSSFALIRDADGQPLYALGHFEDVSEQKRSERALAEATERFRNAFDNAPIGMTLTAPDGSLIQVNPAFCRTLGYEHDLLLAKSFQDLTHPDDANVGVEHRRALLAGRESVAQYEKRYLHADGHGVWCRMSISMASDDSGAPLFFVCQIEDISERKRMEEEIRRSQTLLEEAQKLTQVGSFEWDLETHEIRNSRELHRIHGTDPDTFVPTLDWLISVVHEDDRERMREVWARHTAEPTETFRIIRADGAVRRLVTIARTEFDETGKGVRVYGAVEDVTERVQAEAEHRELEARMQEAQRLESLGVLAGGIAHDFNNLLVGILGNAGLAMLELPSGSPAKLLIDQIEIAAKRAAELTKQMLAYSGRGQFVVRLLDLREVVRETAALLESATSKNVIMRYEFAQDVPAVRADVAQMRQLVMNLITNASDAIGETGGEIVVRIASRKMRKTELRSYSLTEGLPETKYVLLEVRDSGAGMDTETQAKIFDPFFTTKPGGHGLGLAAALGIVRGHHGAIRVVSTLGEGSAFSLIFPAAQDVLERGAVEAQLDPTWEGTGKILVVDDEEIVRRAASKILSSGGLTVVEASNGEEALELFRADPGSYDAALVDLVMPGMNGGDLAGKLRGLRPDLPIVFSSGHDARALTESFEAGTYFLQKPYQARELLNQLRTALGKR